MSGLRIDDFIVGMSNELTARNLTVSAKRGSVIEVAANELTHLLVGCGGASDLNTRLEACETNPFMTDGEVEDDVVRVWPLSVTAICNDIRPIINNLVDTLRNVVMPITDELFDKAKSGLDGTLSTGGMRWDVTGDGWSEELMSAVQLVVGERVGGSITHVTSGELVFPELSEEVILSALEETAKSHDIVDEQFSNLVIQATACTTLVDVYNHYFRGGELVNTGYVSNMVLLSRDLLAVLMAYRFETGGPVEGATGVSTVAAYNSIMADLIDSLCARVIAIKKRIDYEISVGKLVQGRSVLGDVTGVSDLVIYVNDAVYAEYLKSGGSVDALYGAVLVGVEPTMTNLLEDQSSLERTYYRHVAVRQDSGVSEFTRLFKEALIGAIPDVTKAIDVTPHPEINIHIRNDDRVLNPSTAYRFVRDMVCQYICVSPEYTKILDRIEFITNESPRLELDEAINIALIDFVVDWIYAQLDIKSN